MTKRLGEDHSHAQILARGINEIPALCIDPSRVHTNIVIFQIVSDRFDANLLAQHLAEKNILVSIIDQKRIRLIPHCDISGDDINTVLRELKNIVNELN